MNSANPKKDLVILVPDIDIEHAIRGLLTRHMALGIRPVESKVFRFAERDPGCRTQCVDFLRQFQREYKYSLVIFDLHGSGANDQSRDAIESALESNLSNSGWPDCASVVVIDPEIEIWIWSDSPKVDEALGWSGHKPDLHAWLVDQNLVSGKHSKPKNPKDAFKRALREVGKPNSPAIFAQLALNVGIERCTDPAFVKLRNVLRNWFKPHV
jgi:hypothetical protein